MLRDGLTGIAGKLSDIFSKRNDNLRDKPVKANPIEKSLLSGKAIDRIKRHAKKFYSESAYEKIPLARKWTRNSLMYQGYHDLEWSVSNNSFETGVEDYADFAFPNNYFRSQMLYGVGMYLKNPPKFEFSPSADDPDSQAIAQASMKALRVIQKNVKYERMRAWEALYLRLYGNSFRYSYYSLDSRYGTVAVPIMGIDDRSFQDPETGETHSVKVPVQKAIVEYPRGQEVTDVVHPLECYARSTSFDLHDAPFFVRARLVDKKRLQASFTDSNLAGGSGRFSDDLSINYKEMLSELSGDAINPVAWYSQASKDAGVIFLQAWIRPAMYFDDDELTELFPEGLYAGMCGDTLLETRNESMDDHWTHAIYKMVPGRFWGDGEDDAIPKQLQMNTVDQMIAKNVAYNSVPQTWCEEGKVDKDKITNDPGEINMVKALAGKDIRGAVYVSEGHSLSQEVYQWRADIKEDMSYHTNTMGSAIGEHQPGVNTLGGQQLFAQLAEENQSPMYILYKEMNEDWVKQVLKLAADNWLDERVDSVEGLNGQWEFSKLRAASLNPDRVQIEARVLPVDFTEQQSFSQAVAAGVLNPQDPRVIHKALELFNLPTELDSYQMDAKSQWKEIERMVQSAQPMAIRPFIDNDQVHAEICRIWLNSDKSEQEDPTVIQNIYSHMLQHLQHQMMVMNQMAQHPANQPPQKGGSSVASKKSTPANKPKNAGAVHRRAVKGQTAKPKTSQPSSGNQYGRGR